MNRCVKDHATMPILPRANRFVSGAAVALIPIVLLLPSIWQNQASFLLFPDAQEQTYAWMQKLATAWDAGYLALWDANTSSGRSLVGEIQASVFYPIVWLWLALFAGPDGISAFAIELLILLHFSLATGCMWALLRHWGLSQSASIVGALCYGLFGPVAERAAAQPNIFFGLAWLPLAVLCTSRHLQTGKLSGAFLAGAVIGVQVLSGHVQPAFHTAILCGALATVHHWSARHSYTGWLRATAASGACMLGALILIALPQWILTFQYMADVYRWVGAPQPLAPGDSVPYKIFSRHHIVPPSGLAALIDPWRWRADDANTPHLTALGFALAALTLLRREIRQCLPSLQAHWMALIGVAAFALLAMWGHWTPLAHILRKLPLVGQIRELGRYSILLHFVAAVLAAAALHWLSRQPRPPGIAKKLALLLATAAALLSVFASAGWGSTYAAIGMALAAVVLAVTAWNRATPTFTGATAVASVLLCALLYRPLALPSVANAVPAERAFATLPLLAPVEAEYGQARIIFDDSAGLRKNYADAHRLQSRLSHSATMYRPYFDFLAEDWTLGSEVNDLLNMRYVLSREELDLPLLHMDTESGLRLYRRPTAYPRVFLRSRYRQGDPDDRAPDGFKLLHYDDHRMRMRFVLNEADTVIVSELDFPGWCARLNGQPVAISRAALGGRTTPLRAIDAPAGEHELEFSYRPFAFLFGRCAATSVQAPG